MGFDFETGEIILIDKPFEWTSFDVVKKVRNTIRIKKVGHAGTLDPLATGLLVLCTGKMTKKIENIQADEKEYTGELILGGTTPSYDLETAIVPTLNTGIDPPSINQISAAAKLFTGTIQQVPPVYSAIQVNGERLYKKARKGETVEIQARQVHVKEFEIASFTFPKVEFRIVCSKGTYIRSLAHDLGQALGTGAYLSVLRRTRIGDLSIENAFQLTDFIEKVKEQQSNS